MQPKLLFEDKDLGRAFQQMKEVFVEKLPTEATLRGFLEDLMARTAPRTWRPPPASAPLCGGIGPTATTPETWAPSGASSEACGFLGSGAAVFRPRCFRATVAAGRWWTGRFRIASWPGCPPAGWGRA